MAIQFRPRPLSDCPKARQSDIYKIMTAAFHYHWLVDPEEAEAAWIAANGENEKWVKVGRLSHTEIWNRINPYIMV